MRWQGRTWSSAVTTCSARWRTLKIRQTPHSMSCKSIWMKTRCDMSWF
jgi:hypothetical protein